MGTNTGFTAAVRKLIDGIPEEVIFTAADVLAMDSENLTQGKPFPLKSIARALSWLVWAGRIEVVKKVVLPGDTHKTYHYRRCARVAQVDKPMPPEPESRVTMTLKDGVRRVRFGQGWKPQRDARPVVGMSGYQSGLARIL